MDELDDDILEVDAADFEEEEFTEEFDSLSVDDDDEVY